MERRTPQLGRELNYDLGKSLLQWQISQEDAAAYEKVRNLISTASDFGFGIEFKIRKEILRIGESRRAITLRDLKRFSKFDGENFIFRFSPKKNKTAEFMLTVQQKMGEHNLILWGKHDGMIGNFRPQEVSSISVI